DPGHAATPATITMAIVHPSTLRYRRFSSRLTAASSSLSHSSTNARLGHGARFRSNVSPTDLGSILNGGEARSRLVAAIRPSTSARYRSKRPAGLFTTSAPADSVFTALPRVGVQ